MNGELIARIKQRADVPATRTDNSDTLVLPCIPPAAQAALEEAQRRLGFSLPAALADVYLRVGKAALALDMD